MADIPSTIDLRTESFYNEPTGHEATGESESESSGDAIEMKICLWPSESQVAALHENHQSWLEMLDMVRIRFPIPIDLDLAYEGFPFGSTLTASIRVPHRDTGEETKISVSTPVTRLGADASLQVLSLCTKLIIHELEESFYVNGVRVFDPHRGEEK